MSHRRVFDESIGSEIRYIRAGWEELKRTMGTSFDASEDVAKQGRDQLLETMASQLNSLKAAIDLHRRLERLEAMQLPPRSGRLLLVKR